MEIPVKIGRRKLSINFKNQVGVENRRRSLAKSLSWRLIATAITMLVSYIWLGEWTSAVALAITANVIKGLLYYLHERVWNRIDFGRKKVKEDYTV